MTRLYGFAKDNLFPYFCFGRKCYLFKIKYSKLFKKWRRYFGRISSDDALVWIMHSSEHIRFYGIIKTDRKTMYDIFNE